MQRVAIGRALVRRPKALLLDEPIGSLDAKLREGMRVELKRLHLENGSTSIYVTHDQVEAMSLADRIVVMNDGILQQVGTPTEVYLHPANLFVAQFIGSPVMNITSDRRQRSQRQGADRRRQRQRSSCRASCSACCESKKAGSDLSLGVRPEGVLVSRDDAAGLPPGRGAYHPAVRRLRHRRSQGRRARRCGPAPPPASSARPASAVWARIDPAQAHFFDTKSGASLDIRLGD